MHERIRAAQVAGHREHHSQSVLCDGHGVGAGRVHHGDPFVSRRVQINVVHADAGAADHAQFMSVFQQLCVSLHGGTHNQLDAADLIVLRLPAGQHA